MAGKKKEKKANKKAKRTAKKAAKPAKRATKRTAPARKAAAAKPALKARKQPESLRLRSASPSLTVNDLQRSMAFYQDTLGFTLKDRWEEKGQLKGVELLAGSVSFFISQDDWKKGRDRAKGQGLRLYCATSQDIDGLAARVKAGGHTLAEEPTDRPWGGRDFAVRDPDGFTISFTSGV
jgi:uncharacterized glyoxalase superfamily protein PhnB